MSAAATARNSGHGGRDPNLSLPAGSWDVSVLIKDAGHGPCGGPKNQRSAQLGVALGVVASVIPGAAVGIQTFPSPPGAGMCRY